MKEVTLKLVENTISSPQSQLTMIAAGKGGVGCTWLAISLANALGQQGKKVLLIDGNLNMANIDIQIGIMPLMDLGHFFQYGLSLPNIVSKFPEGNFDIIAGRSGSTELSTLSYSEINVLIKEVQDLALNYDHVIIDTGSIIGDVGCSFAQISNKCLIVLTCEPTSIINAYTYIKFLKINHDHTHFDIVINQSHSALEAEQAYQVLNNICQKFLNINPLLLAVIPQDDSIRLSIQSQTLHSLHNDLSPSYIEIKDLSHKLHAYPLKI